MKGYKITDKNRSKLVGIACNSLHELLMKGSQKLNLSGKVIAALDDGTIIDFEDYFMLLPAQTVITLYKEGEEIMTGADYILKTLRSLNSLYLNTGAKAKELVLSKTDEIINLLKLEDDATVLKSSKTEDPKWFEDLDTNATTKEEFMFRKSQDRIRNFFYRFQDDVRKSDAFLKHSTHRKIIQDCLRFFKKQLKNDQYFGCYFDRRCAPIKKEFEKDLDLSSLKNKKPKYSDKMKPDFYKYEKQSLCDPSGKFLCQGGWKIEHCEFSFDHQINPYVSRETRILFSTWNLDHRIEKSRTIIPTFLDTVKDCASIKTINFSYFYQLMFTTVNLKLVHVVCHDKSAHNLFCDPRFLVV